jgi:cyclopropane-fatty-acyl-phospholipid synthase
VAAAPPGGLMLSLGLELAERGRVPLPLLRAGIRRLLASRLREARTAGGLDAFLRELEGAPVAPVPEAANAQHYELPAEFFGLVLGPHLKYSCAWWPPGVNRLEDAEAAALELTAERAGLADGQRILELGCGWGSLSLYLARRFPAARITAVSNSSTQRAFIEARAPANLTVVTADMNGFDPRARFDRVVSVEMFEHMRNWRALLGRVASWLEGDGRLFVHVFCHARHAYPFETAESGDWMGRHFFTGGIMPAYDLLPRASDAFAVEERWWLDGRHYQRTAAAWRANLEARRAEVTTVLRRHYGADAGRWYQRWRLFFLACEELFGFHGGSEWGVGHYRLARAERGAALAASSAG